MRIIKGKCLVCGKKMEQLEIKESIKNIYIPRHHKIMADGKTEVIISNVQLVCKSCINGAVKKE